MRIRRTFGDLDAWLTVLSEPYLALTDFDKDSRCDPQFHLASRARGGGAVASAGSDGNLVVARPDGARLALTARRGVRLTEGLAFSADGRVLAEVAATASPSRAVEVRLWDLTTGDTALLTVAADGVMAWPLDAAILRPRVCAAAGREFTPAEWQRFFGAVIPPQPLCTAP